MKKLIPVFALVAAFSHPLVAAPEVGKPAPEFALKDCDGKEHRLSDFKGKVVVLEWVNHGCPFVKKHYSGGNMQKLQKAATDKGVVWLSVCSSAPGKQGHMSGGEAGKMCKDVQSNATAYLLDEDGTVGTAYDAKTTPNMFVINEEGILVYKGAIDDKPSVDVADNATAKNYVMAAIEETLADKPVTVSSTKPYGCSVKY